MSSQQIPVAILGATGAVGQKLIRLVDAHPDFKIAELAASSGNMDKRYKDACIWRETAELKEDIANMKLKSVFDIESKLVLSALPSEAAKETEDRLAKEGHFVVSNASTNRLRKDVPLLIPEVNLDHLSLIDMQKTSGKIITNPNCSTVFAALALKPLIGLGEIKHISVFTLQAISGAGYPGISSCDILGNTIPNIPGEEEKIEAELLKIFGDGKKNAPFFVTVHTNRVPVLHGHTIVMHVEFAKEIKKNDVLQALERAKEKHQGAYKLYEDPFAPQPRQHTHDTDNRAHIGRVKVGTDKHTVGLTVMGHNLVRGAAGAALLNLEAIEHALKEYL